MTSFFLSLIQMYVISYTESMISRWFIEPGLEPPFPERIVPKVMDINSQGSESPKTESVDSPSLTERITKQKKRSPLHIYLGVPPEPKIKEEPKKRKGKGYSNEPAKKLHKSVSDSVFIQAVERLRKQEGGVERTMMTRTARRHLIGKTQHDY